MGANFDAVVVGSGPNGLACAIELARAGRKVKLLEGQPTFGGGARSAALTLPGFTHDLCSAIHPLAASSPFFQSLPLEQFGLQWAWPDAQLAHPLDDGTAAVLERSVEATAATLGPDAKAWIKLMKPFVDRWDDFRHLLFEPVTRIPKSPVLLARLGLQALRPAFDLAEEEFEGAHAKALFAGCAAHSFGRLTAALTSSLGFALIISGHAVGWPTVRGGTQKLSDALLGYFRSLGGEAQADFPVQSFDQLPEAKAWFFDTSARTLARICGPRLPARYHRAIDRFRPGPAAFKLDYALDAPMPWTNEACRRAGTLHLGGTLGMITQSEAETNAGTPPERPYVLVAQQSLFDDTRAPSGQHTLWAYCHVPNGSTFDMTARIEAQLERFAPGFQQHVLHRATKRPQDFEASNANYQGGDISAGGLDGLQLFFRPTIALTP
ncbi:MAG: Phytoene dehydrogenase, partial [Myxococcaceae bacterium]|nr:Phytoene dehydrogenase [Myxococcaceae bacterium]